ncbi:uncharacterized protein MKK02DRAFT_31035 [Dioszegia hungarica]|uniref:Uncharacterized protein n=1 Tax=Dioszegia hungarica TaxID=4972 RepID=A0AA38HBZ5_9TREE|nr:uncharacterized protein MKK02DRAFT_31035 [Dioszegia hungarica]KAI9638708.1 hypothetical protein MKK02DRAFT_31035 [Dioszegia hungarica]
MSTSNTTFSGPTPALLATLPRSMSMSSASSVSSTSSVYSRTADDLIDRLAAQDPHSTLHLWSAGNIRLSSGRDLTVPIQESTELIKAMQRDARFELVGVHHYGHDEDDWKISFRRTTIIYAPSSPSLSDSE